MTGLSARELHIYVTQGLQRQGAFKKDKQFDPAVDIALTKAQNRIVKSRLIPVRGTSRFETNTKTASDIEALIVLDYPILISIDKIYPKKVNIQLPNNFAYLLGDTSLVIEDCLKGFSNPDPKLSITEKIITIPFASTTAPYYKTIVVSANGKTENLTSIGFSSVEEKVYLVDYIIDLYNSFGVEAYWQKYKNVTALDSFIVVTRDESINAGLTVDSTSANVTSKTNQIDIYNTELNTIANLAINRNIKSDHKFNELLSSKYHQPTPDSPISVLNQKQLSVYQSKRFLVSSIFVDYIRKPKRINLALNQGSELNDTVHEEVADLAIRLIKKQIEDDSYIKEVEDTVNRIE